MNYQIINNPLKFKEFIEWLPELEVNEKYYYCLFSRRKYCLEMMKSNDKAQLKRGLSSKKDLYNKVLQLECELGCYQLNGLTVPQESLALYINPNPRDMIKASWLGTKKILQCLEQNAQGFNPIAEMLSAAQQSYSKKPYFDIDFDNIEYEVIKPKILELINENCLTPIKTRGGFHLLIKLDSINNEFKRNWYNITKLEGADVNNDMLLPVIGCTQGNFTPYFIK